MEKMDIVQKIARYESLNDQLITELSMIDQLMREVGFINGLVTVKETAEALKNSRRDDQ